MSDCTDSDINIDWQYGTAFNPGESIPDISPLGELQLITVSCSYDAGTGSVSGTDQIDGFLLDRLQKGQADNADAKASYANCHAALGFWPFWTKLMTASPGYPADFGQALTDLKYSKSSSTLIGFIQAAQTASNAALYLPTGPGQWFFQMQVMYNLMMGQSWNALATRNYRACFASDPVKLIQLLQSV